MELGLSLSLTSPKGVGVTPQSLFRRGDAGDSWEGFARAGTLDATVATLSGKRGQHDFTQGTDGNRPLLKARADGVRYLDFASGKSMAVAASTALFKYLHDGTGGTVLALVDWPQGSGASTLISTCSSSAQVGFYLAKVNTNQRLNWVVERGGVGTHVVNSTGAGWAVGWSGRWQMISLRYKNDGGATDFIGGFNNGLTKFSAAGLGSPSAASANNSLTLNSTFGGKIYALLVIARKLTDAEVAGIYAYWKARIDETVTAPTLVVGLGGQSNASGRGVVDSTPPTTTAGGWELDRSEEYRRLYEPSHNIINQPVATSPTEVSTPAISFATYLSNDLVAAGLTPLFVPGAVGSTSIAQWDTPATVDDRSTLFGALVYRMRRALAERGGTPVLVWYGHEGSRSLSTPDYTAGGVGTAYQIAWASLITNLRTALGATIPVVFVQLSGEDSTAAGGGISNCPAMEAQRQTELTVAQSYMVVAHDVARNVSPDDMHVSKAGLAALGPRIALAIRQHVLGHAVNGTGPRYASASRSSATVTLTCDKAINTTAGDYGALFRVYDNGVEATVSSANRNGGDTSKIDIACSAPLTGPVTLTYGYRAGLASAPRTDFVADSDGLPLPAFGPILVP